MTPFYHAFIDANGRVILKWLAFYSPARRARTPKPPMRLRLSKALASPITSPGHQRDYLSLDAAMKVLIDAPGLHARLQPYTCRLSPWG